MGRREWVSTMFDPDPVGDGLFPPSGHRGEDEVGATAGSEAELLDQLFHRNDLERPLVPQVPSGGRILLPYSGSESAEFALEATVQLFGGAACEVHVVHFREWIASRAGPSFVFNPAQARRLADHAALRLRRSGLRASAVVRDSHRSMVPTRIVGEAEDLQADAVVLGARRRRALAAAVLGSVSRQVARLSPRPVVLVHPPHLPYRGGAARRTRSSPLDPSRGSHAA